MQMLIRTILTISVFTLISNAQGAIGKELKPEGNCSGQLLDGTEVSLAYYSDFDGCQKVSRSAITFQSGIEGLTTGSRAFKGENDVYNFPKYKLTFQNSTGNTSGTLEYRDTNRDLQSVELQCEVRDYEFPDC